MGDGQTSSTVGSLVWQHDLQQRMQIIQIRDMSYHLENGKKGDLDFPICARFRVGDGPVALN